VLERVERTGSYADLALHGAFERNSLQARERAFATELAYGTLRWRGRLDFLLEQVLDRSFDKLEPPVASLLRLGAYQLAFVDAVPAAVAVAESVRLAQAVGLDRASGLINAVLRRLSERLDQLSLPDLATDPLAHLTHALSIPGWLAARWLEEFGPEEAAALATASNRAPPRTVRTNRSQLHRDALLDELQKRFPDARPCVFASEGIVLGRKGDPARDPAFLAGYFTIQDEASQVVVELLDPQSGERVLDACAAPGAKATAIAERVGADGSVLATDRHERRLGLLARDARRLGLRTIQTTVADATQPLPGDAAERLFDRVLVDAPCSGLGTLRRNPDARWRVQPDSLDRLADLQRALLSRASAVLRPGGTLVYSTCTLAREENEDVIDAFLSDFPDFHPAEETPEALRALRGDTGAIHLYPHRHDSDGFFAARLKREES
jgi:16S rRNA (cytosine967-C5)-methyltransferase